MIKGSKKRKKKPGSVFVLWFPATASFFFFCKSAPSNASTDERMEGQLSSLRLVIIFETITIKQIHNWEAEAFPIKGRAVHITRK